jgi:hypothetical protein
LAIQGYPAQPGVLPGETLVLHVSTDAPRFRVDFYRQGRALTFLSSSGWLPGRYCPPHLPFQDWGEDDVGLNGEHLPGWPGYRFTLPADWQSGVYIAMFVQGDEHGNVIDAPDDTTPDGRDAKALFVVKSAAPGKDASILYKLPLFTYHAYNQAVSQAYDPVTRQGGWCLYTVPRPEQLPVAVPPTVNIRRPGGGTGGTPWDMFNFDPFDPTPRQTFVHWDAPFIAWLEKNGYRVDYCTDLDIHQEDGPMFLAAYRLLLCVGHDEYWSDAMRVGVEGFIRQGHNVAFLSGNTCWWRIAFDDAFSFRRLHYWWNTPVPNNPENALTGVSFRNGGERDQHQYPQPVGYRVQHADHWVYAGTGLGEGEIFGDGPEQYIVGYECDGAEFDRAALLNGHAAQPTGNDGTPANFIILGIGDVGASGWGLGNKAATMGLYSNNGTVFTASTTDWVRVVADGAAPAVEQITRNVLDRLG